VTRGAEDVVLRAAAAPVCVAVDLGAGVPAITRWGVPLAAEPDPRALARPLTHGALDQPAPLTLVPEHGAGYPGRPGLLGHRAGGRHWSPSTPRERMASGW
jgi:alpha-galactosidase